MQEPSFSHNRFLLGYFWENPNPYLIKGKKSGKDRSKALAKMALGIESAQVGST
jgi:hypothetical protein